MWSGRSFPGQGGRQVGGPPARKKFDKSTSAVKSDSQMMETGEDLNILALCALNVFLILIVNKKRPRGRASELGESVMSGPIRE